ncbi:hypothetical protein ScalyP_jg3211 [Parmales sp. scaly parma]|nr:hypothetical protein ScalyP_jg3211 [Parmales sp. scaly parma]
MIIGSENQNSDDRKKKAAEYANMLQQQIVDNAAVKSQAQTEERAVFAIPTGNVEKQMKAEVDGVRKSKQAQYREELDAQCNARKADKAAADQYVVSETALKDRPF